MKIRGAYRIANQRVATPDPGARGFDPWLHSLVGGGGRTQRVIDSLRSEILEGGGGQNLRIRQVFQNPREIYRLELQLPELAYHRTTLLDREALEELLESDDVRAVVSRATAEG